MKNRLPFILISLVSLLAACSASHQAFDPNRKFPPSSLKSDFHIFRSILEESHPSLYWFTSKDSMDRYFEESFASIKDSMTEPAFRLLLTRVINQIHCGHTSVNYSKKYARYLDSARFRMFPLSLKVWPGSMAVTFNLNPRDSLLKRGTLLTKINGRSAGEYADTFFNYLVSDGLGLSGKYQSLSGRGSFGALYRNVFGLPDSFRVEYLTPSGEETSLTIPVFDPRADTGKKAGEVSGPKPDRQTLRYSALNIARNVQLDTALGSAYMTVNTFARGNRLRSFYKKSFRLIRDLKIKSLVVDVRNNGGGDAGLSTLLTEYLTKKKFRLADSLYTRTRTTHYGRFIKKNLFYSIATRFVTHREKDGLYHFGFFERHYFKPRKRFHFGGDIYIITGGNSFSATTLFVKMLQGQPNVLVVGEETGGGGYGNTAWMIPEVRLPETGLRFRLPRFRLVMDAAAVKSGRGILPDIEVSPTPETIRQNIDPKAARVHALILQKMSLSSQ